MIEISFGATITPAIGMPQDFTEPVVYTVTAINGTEKNWTVTVLDNTVGINGYDILKSLIYPNPAKDKITISIDNLTTDNLQFEIYDLMGRVVSQLSNGKLSNSQLTIDIYNLQSGIYFLKVNNQVIKFIKE